MYIIESNQISPYYNAALEEFLFKEKTDMDFLLIYTNEPSVLIGKHQNAYQEINYPHIKQNKINIVRRISGGGAVYHDAGNINYSIIRSFGYSEKIPSFNNFLSPVCSILNDFGLKTYLGEKNDIRSGAYKLSGNAWHIFKNRVLHHGTLLFNANLNEMTSSLNGNSEAYYSRAVQSNRSIVNNISALLENNLNQKDFYRCLINRFYDFYPIKNSYILNPNEHFKVFKLLLDKYLTWEWNFAYSPDYKFSKDLIINNVKLNISFNVSKGFIIDSQVLINHTDTFSNSNPLQGLLHREEDLKFFLNKNIHFFDVFNSNTNNLLLNFL